MHFSIRILPLNGIVNTPLLAEATGAQQPLRDQLMKSTWPVILYGHNVHPYPTQCLT